MESAEGVDERACTVQCVDVAVGVVFLDFGRPFHGLDKAVSPLNSRK